MKPPENTRRIENSIMNNPYAPDHQIAKNLKIRSSEVAKVRAGLTTQPSPDVSGGIVLSHLRVLPRKPADSASKFIKRLPTGRGFEIKNLVSEWGIGEDTIRRHAKDMGCLKYVEVSDDEWLAVIMNPETAQSYV